MTATTVATALEDSPHCPYHPEPYLMRRTKWPSLLPIMRAIDDEVYYCAGDDGTCSWVWSKRVGLLVLPGLESTPAQVKRAYQRAITELVQTEQQARRSANEPQEERRGYLESYRKRYGRLPWEKD